MDVTAAGDVIERGRVYNETVNIDKRHHNQPCAASIQAMACMWWMRVGREIPLAYVFTSDGIRMKIRLKTPIISFYKSNYVKITERFK